MKILNFDSSIATVSAGTAAAPSISFANDPNTGIYSPGADQVAISTGGTGRLLVDASGRVGIGTSSPGAILHLSAVNPEFRFQGTNGTGATHKFRTTGLNDQSLQITSADDLYINASAHVFRSQNEATERARIDSSGRLLVGTNSSREGWYTSTNPHHVQVESSGYTLQSWTANNSINSDTGAYLSVARCRGGAGTYTLVNSGDMLGRFAFHGADGSKFVESAFIEGRVDGTPGTNDMPGRLVFATTADGAASPTERMRLTSTGQLRLAGAGITFNGDTATANELDDYEEGTFTPTIFGLGTAGTLTYTRQTGRYVKVGGIVHVSVELKIDAISVAPTSDLVLGGFPFTSANIEANFAYTGALRTNGVDLPAGAAGVFGIILNNATTARLQVNTDDGVPSGILGSGISAGDEFGFTTSYRTV